MSVYYNEIDPFAVAWLKELMKFCHIAPGDIDTRSIEDVLPTDLLGYTQCHFFAGIGVWSYALRQAGWSDSRPVWTGSCPCQPFSIAGKRKGVADQRHLWPAFFHLISQCKPHTVFGEQVASKDGLTWIDTVYSDLEAANYIVGAVDTPAAGFGAPHIRQRLYWVANSKLSEKERLGKYCRESIFNQKPERLTRNCSIIRLENSHSLRRNRWSEKNTGRLQQSIQVKRLGSASYTHATNGFWKATDWLFCRDGKWRAVEPSTFPLAHGVTARVGRLRGYGNAIVAPQAQAFIKSFMEVINEYSNSD